MSMFWHAPIVHRGSACTKKLKECFSSPWHLYSKLSQTVFQRHSDCWHLSRHKDLKIYYFLPRRKILYSSFSLIHGDTPVNHMLAIKPKRGSKHFLCWENKTCDLSNSPRHANIALNEYDIVTLVVMVNCRCGCHQCFTFTTRSASQMHHRGNMC